MLLSPSVMSPRKYRMTKSSKEEGSSSSQDSPYLSKLFVTGRTKPMVLEGQTTVDDDLQYFEDSLASIFDDVAVTHGEPGGELIYESIYGNLPLHLTETSSWDETLKFSHFVWEAELNLAKRIERGSINLQDLRVLELGAGAGLCGILAVLSGAKDVVLSDFPAQSMINNLQRNVDRLLPSADRTRASVIGHIWGEETGPLINAGLAGLFDVILLADCLWMPEQHEALCKSLAACLKKTATARIYCVAGFHSGRKKMSSFFPHAEKLGIVPCGLISELNHKGAYRIWDASRPEEDSVERKRWLVIADLGWNMKHCGTVK